MHLTIHCLHRGILAFKARWPQETDFHAGFYSRLHQDLASGVTEAVWSALVNDLTSWGAIRPLPRDEVYRRGIALLPRLDSERRRLADSKSGRSPSIAEASWADLAQLFAVASEIKAVSSPVFPSKLCHFLAPELYPVCDGAFANTSARSYSEFWAEASGAWRGCPDRERLIACLRAEIRSGDLDGYPWATKLVDLCHAGMGEDV